MGTLLVISTQIASVPALKAQIMYSRLALHHIILGELRCDSVSGHFHSEGQNQCLILLHPSHESMHLNRNRPMSGCVDELILLLCMHKFL